MKISKYVHTFWGLDWEIHHFRKDEEEKLNFSETDLKTFKEAIKLMPHAIIDKNWHLKAFINVT